MRASQRIVKEQIEEDMLDELREMPRERLELLAATWCPLPRRLWPGETMKDAQIREYVQFRREIARKSKRGSV